MMGVKPRVCLNCDTVIFTKNSDGTLNKVDTAMSFKVYTVMSFNAKYYPEGS